MVLFRIDGDKFCPAYNKALAAAGKDNKKFIKEKIKKHEDRKNNYQNMQRDLA